MSGRGRKGKDGYVRCRFGIGFMGCGRHLRGCVSRCARRWDRHVQRLTGIYVSGISQAVGLLQGGYGGIENHPNVIECIPGAHIIDTPSMRLPTGYRRYLGSGYGRLRGIRVLGL